MSSQSLRTQGSHDRRRAALQPCSFPDARSRISASQSTVRPPGLNRSTVTIPAARRLYPVSLRCIGSPASRSRARFAASEPSPVSLRGDAGPRAKSVASHARPSRPDRAAPQPCSFPDARSRISASVEMPARGRGRPRAVLALPCVETRCAGTRALESRVWRLVWRASLSLSLSLSLCRIGLAYARRVVLVGEPRLEGRGVGRLVVLAVAPGLLGACRVVLVAHHCSPNEPPHTTLQGSGPRCEPAPESPRARFESFERLSPAESR